jgi:hypothetical protein
MAHVRKIWMTHVIKIWMTHVIMIWLTQGKGIWMVHCNKDLCFLLVYNVDSVCHI